VSRVDSSCLVLSIEGLLSNFLALSSIIIEGFLRLFLLVIIFFTSLVSSFLPLLEASSAAENLITYSDPLPVM